LEPASTAQSILGSANTSSVSQQPSRVSDQRIVSIGSNTSTSSAASNYNNSKQNPIDRGNNNISSNNSSRIIDRRRDR